MTNPDRRNIRKDYYNWLYSHVDGIRPTCQPIVEALFNTVYIPRIEMDSNREMDGVRLRDVFIEEMNISDERYFDLDGPCSILEMLIAIAKRMAWILDGYEDNTLGDYFWELVDNLSLGKGDDVLKAIYDGYLFSVDGRDNKDLELWSQMNIYCSKRLTYDGFGLYIDQD